MNTIKFSSIYEPRTETHNVEIYKENTILLNNKEYKVDSHCGLMIYPSIHCNAKCSLCINKFDKSISSCIDINDNNEYMLKLENVFNILKPLNPSISICGGEPSISERTIPILNLVKKYDFVRRTLPTNGTGLLARYDNKPLLQHMLENGFINNINLSRMSHIEEENNKLMGIKLSNKEVKRIVTFCNTNHMSLRTSCVLQQKGINNLDDMLEYQKYFKNISVESQIFREQIKVSNIFKERNFVSALDIMNEIDNDNRFEFIRNLNGAYYSIDVYKYKDNLVKCYKEKFQKDIEMIRDFVFMPDGHLYIAKINKENELIF